MRLRRSVMSVLPRRRASRSLTISGALGSRLSGRSAYCARMRLRMEAFVGTEANSETTKSTFWIRAAGLRRIPRTEFTNSGSVSSKLARLAAIVCTEGVSVATARVCRGMSSMGSGKGVESVTTAGPASRTAVIIGLPLASGEPTA